MEPYLRYLHTYVSVSGPHLGYLYSSNSLFNSGLWLLKKLKGTQCIHQLTFTDDPDIHNTFLYKLCKVVNWYCHFPSSSSLFSSSSFSCWRIYLIFIFFLRGMWDLVFAIAFRSDRLNFLFFQQKTLEHFKNIILLSSPQVFPFFLCKFLSSNFKESVFVVLFPT